MSASGRAQDDTSMTSEDRNALLGGLQDTLDVNLSLVARDPDNTEWQHDLAVTYNRIGALRWTGSDLEGALRSFEESVAIGKALIARNNKNTAWLQELCYAAGSVGTLLIDLGKQKPALEFFELERSLVRRLIAKEPDNTDYRRELSATLERIVEIRLAGSDYGLIHPVVEQRIEVCSRLAARDPDKDEWQHDLSSAHYEQGILLSFQWHAERSPPSAMEKALSAFRRSLDIRKRLVDKDPENAPWLHALSCSQIMAGHVLIDLGKLDEALPYLEASREIRERLVRQDLADANRQVALANVHHSIGECLAAMGDLDAALDAFYASVSLLEGLIERKPEDDSLKKGLVRGYAALGDACSAQGDTGHTAEILSKRSSIIDELLESDPVSQCWQWEKMATHGKMSALQFSNGDIKDGVDHLQESLTTSARLIEQHAGNGDFFADMLINLRAAVSWLSDKTHWSHAVALLEHADAIFERLTETRPDDPAFRQVRVDIGQWLDDVRAAKERASSATLDSAFSAFADGHRLEQRGDLEGALSAFEKGLQIVRQCAEEPSDFLRCQQLLISKQVESSNIASRNGEPAKAKQYFEQALAIAVALGEDDRLPRDLVRTVDRLRSRLRDLDAPAPNAQRTESEGKTECEKGWWRQKLSQIRKNRRNQGEAG